MPFDLEISCFGTLKKYIDNRHEVHLIIAKNRDNWTKTMISGIKESAKIVGISQVHLTKRFDYSAVTQDNVNVLRTIIEPINPTISIIPSLIAVNKMRMILAKSALLACREVRNILMYEIDKNESFLPSVYSIISDEFQVKISCLSAYPDYNKFKNKLQNKMKLINGCCKEIKSHVEEFESHRLVLLDRDHAQ